MQQEPYGTANKLENIFMEKSTPKNFSELEVPFQKCFWIDNLLTQNECKEFINLTEKLGYEDLKEFKKETRNSTRCFIYSKSLASELWNRIKPFEKNFKNLKPYGVTDNEGIWRPYGIDECFRFNKYTKDNFFKRHVDAVYCESNHEKSILSVLVYLNDDFKGGNTKIWKDFDSTKPLHFIKSKAGSALIFTHDLIHEGAKVEDKIKYVVRIDIMFRRIDTHSYTSRFTKDSKEYQEVERYMKESFQYEKKGDLENSVISYLEGLQLQLKHRSVTQSTLPLPYEIFLQIFSYLEPNYLVSTLTVSREWNKYARDPEVWYGFYRSKWEEMKHDSLKDWYFLYTKRSISQKEFRYFIMNLEEDGAKYSFFDSKNLSNPNFIPCKWILKESYYGVHMVSVLNIIQFQKDGLYQLYDQKGFKSSNDQKVFKEFVNQAINKASQSFRYNIDYLSHPLIFIDQNFPKSFLVSISNILHDCPAIFFLNQGLCILNYHELQNGYVFYQKEKEIEYDIIENNSFIKREVLKGDLKQFVLDTKDVKSFIFCDFKENYEKDEEMMKKGKLIHSTKDKALEGASKLSNISNRLFGFENSQVMLKNVNEYHQKKIMSKYSLFFMKNTPMNQKTELEKYVSNCYDIFGRVPIHISAYYCELEEIKSWINVGADYNLKEKKYGQTILHIAVSRYKDRKDKAFDVLKYCVEILKMDVNQQDKDGWTALHIAYWKNSKKVIDYLENNGAQKLKNNQGKTP